MEHLYRDGAAGWSSGTRKSCRSACRSCSVALFPGEWRRAPGPLQGSNRVREKHPHRRPVRGGCKGVGGGGGLTWDMRLPGIGCMGRSQPYGRGPRCGTGRFGRPGETPGDTPESAPRIRLRRPTSGRHGGPQAGGHQAILSGRLYGLGRHTAEVLADPLCASMLLEEDSMLLEEDSMLFEEDSMLFEEDSNPPWLSQRHHSNRDVTERRVDPS
jgi:hypothetical protein